MLYSMSRSRRTKQIALILFICMIFTRLFAQDQAISGASHDLTPRTDVYAIFSIPPDERSWPALDSLGVGWVRLQNQMGETNQQAALQFFNRVLTEGYGLWLTLGHRERSNVADTARFDASSRGSFPPADSLQYKELMRSNIQPLVDLLTSQSKDPGKWLVVQFANEVAPEDVLPPSPIRFFHGTSDDYLATLRYTHDAVKSIAGSIPIAAGGISSKTLEFILSFSQNPSDTTLKKIVEWNERLLAEGIFDWADIHLYHTVAEIPAKVAWVRERWSGPLAATEVGGPDTSTGAEYTETSHAEELPGRINTTIKAGVDRVFWSFLRDMDIPGDHLAQNLGLIALDWRFKPAFSVYRDLIAAAVTSVSEDPVPTEFSLSQNYPNPFNPETEIRYQLASVNNVELTIYNVAGRHVRTLVRAAQNAGPHSIIWNGRDNRGNEVASGIYLYRLSAGEQMQTRRMVLLR